MVEILLPMLALSAASPAPPRPLPGDGPEIVEVLKDAQATNRDAWKRGRAAFRLEISTSRKPGMAVLEGEARWDDTDMVLKYKVSDPEGVRYKDRGGSLTKEWNYIARNSKKVITYAAGPDSLDERDATPGAFEPLYDLSPLTQFSRCCPPYGVQGRPWGELIGPSPAMPEAFRKAKFTHATRPGGDVEQTRVDEDGGKVVVVFSARDGFAVRSSVSFDPAGKVESELEYHYRERGDGPSLPAGITSVTRSVDRKAETTFRYTFSDVRLPGDVAPGDFTRDAVLARIRRETDHGRRGPGRAAPKKVDDALLDSMSKSLRESGLARPRP